MIKQPVFDVQRKSVKLFTLLLAAFFFVLLGSTVYAQTAYWTNTSDAQIPGGQVNLTGTATQIIRLQADVPEGSTLQAYKFTVNYDATVVEVVKAGSISSFNTFINDKTPGTVIFNGFSTTGITGPGTAPLIEVTLKGLKDGSSEFSIVVNTFGAGSNDQITLSTVPVTVNVSSITTESHYAFFADDTDVRFTDDQTELSVGESQIIRLQAEIPAGKILQAYKFTLIYDPAIIEVLTLDKLSFTLFENEPEPGKIVFNGFVTSYDYAGPMTIPLADLTIKGLATGTSVFGITANNFGQGGGDQFLPATVPLTINVGKPTEDYYTITATAGADGTVTPAGTVLVNEGANQKFIFTPNGKYLVDEVFIDGESVGQLKEFTFTEVNANHTIHVTFKLEGPDYYTITATAGEHGTMTPTGEVLVSEYTDRTFMFIPDNGYVTDDVLIDGMSLGSLSDFTFTDVDADHTIHVVFRKYRTECNLCLAVTPTYQSVHETGGLAYFSVYNSCATYQETLSTVVASQQTMKSAMAETSGLMSERIAGVGTPRASDACQMEWTATENAGWMRITGGSSGTIVGTEKQNITVSCDANYGNERTGTIMLSAPYAEPTYATAYVTQQEREIPPYYTIYASAGTDGTITPSGSLMVQEYASQLFTFTPKAGYKVEDVFVDGVSAGASSDYTFSYITSKHSIYVTFTPEHYLTVVSTTPGKGATDVSIDTAISATFSESLDEDTINTSAFVIKTGSGYELKTVTGSISYSDATIEFKPDTSPDYGKIYTVTVSRDVKSVNGYSPANDYVWSFTTAAAESVKYTITATAGDNGTISPSEAKVIKGGSQTFTFKPDDGYVIDDVKKNNVSVVNAVVNNSYTVKDVTSDTTIDVTFKEIPTYIIKAKAENGGTISPSGEVEVIKGGSQTFTFTPNAGYEVADVSVDGKSVGILTSYPFTNVTEKHNISVTFKKKTYTVTATAGANGSISPSETVSVEEGKSRMFTFTPDDGYEIADVKKNNVSVVNDVVNNSYTFDGTTTGTHTIDVTFKEIVGPAITATSGNCGTISPSGKVTVKYGENKTFTFTTNYGYEIKDVLVDDISKGAISSYQFTNVTSDHKIHVIFEYPIDAYIQMVSFPYNGAAVSGDSLFYMWEYKDDKDDKYVRYNDGKDLTTIAGKAYWCYAPNGVNLEIRGGTVVSDSKPSLELKEKWNMIGSPKVDSYKWDDLTKDGIDDKLWRWDTEKTQYFFYSSENTESECDKYRDEKFNMEKNEGYWVYANKSTSLIFPADAQATATILVYNHPGGKWLKMLTPAEAVADAGCSPPSAPQLDGISTSVDGSSGGCFIDTCDRGSNSSPIQSSWILLLASVITAGAVLFVRRERK